MLHNFYTTLFIRIFDKKEDTHVSRVYVSRHWVITFITKYVIECGIQCCILDYIIPLKLDPDETGIRI